MYGCSIERRLKSTLGRACKKNKGLYEAVLKKMDEVIKTDIPHISVNSISFLLIAVLAI